MTIDHLPSPLNRYTQESLGFVSAAEGFVFLSGYVAGLTYTRALVQRGAPMVWRRALRRAGQIYGYHLAIFAVVFGLVKLFGVPSGFGAWRPLMELRWLTALLLGASLLCQPKFMDILPMYCMFLVVMPLLLLCLQRKKLWLFWGCAWVVWALAQCGAWNLLAGGLSGRWPVMLGDFDFPAWQLLFVAGLWFGFCRANSPEAAPSHRLTMLAAATVAALCFLVRHGFLLEDFRVQFGDLVSKRALGPLRILNFAAVGALVSFRAIWGERWFWVRWLAYLGRNSLQVFSVHILAVSLIFIGCPGLEESSGCFQLAMVAVALTSLYSAALVRETWRKPATGLPTGDHPGSQ
jgi:hypothetical protein